MFTISAETDCKSSGVLLLWSFFNAQNFFEYTVIMKKEFRLTLMAARMGFFTQALVNNLAPVFFVLFRVLYGFSYLQVGILAALNFTLQLFADITSPNLISRFGYRKCAMTAQALCAVGLILMPGLCILTGGVYISFIIPVLIYSYGAGMIEVLASPIVEAIPDLPENTKMSMLHSFYSWGQMTCVALTTLALHFIGYERWFLIPVLWSAIPIFGIILFSRARLDMADMAEKESEKGGRLFCRSFVLMLIIMTCAGASEIAMSEWSSLFAEEALGVSKVAGDLFGPCMFALFMGMGRMCHAKFGERLNLSRLIKACSLLCVICYVGAALLRPAAASLIFCALTGLSVSLMWPGALSLAAARNNGGARMYGLLAAFGDIGCIIGPVVTSSVSEFADGNERIRAIGAAYGLSADKTALRASLLAMALIPLVMLICLSLFSDKGRENE